MFRFLGRSRRRVQLAVLLVALGMCIGLCLRKLRKSYEPIHDEIDEAFDIVKARHTFEAPEYEKWPGTGDESSARNCAKYWKMLLKKPDSYFQSPFPEFDLDPRIYKRSKWIIHAKKELRNSLNEQSLRLNDEHIKDLQARFLRESVLVSQLEQHFVDHIRNLRVLGKHISTEVSKSKSPNDKAKAVIGHLLPWLKKEDSILGQLFESAPIGDGIVITICKDSQLSVQIDRVARLLRVLRVQGNKLPVQIAFSGTETFPEEKRELLTNVATSDSDFNENVLGRQTESLNASYEKQIVSFLNVDQYVRRGVAISDNLMYAIAVLFCGLENVAVLNSRTIPMASDLAAVFEGDEFQKQGMLFFKHRPSLESKPEPFPPGFFEANELVNRYAAVSTKEASVFGMKVPQNTHTKRVTVLGFQRLLDPSMAVFNTQKARTGLLISSILPTHSVLRPKYDISTKLNPDLLWLGQELAGTSEVVHFNRAYAALPGVLTPRENLPPQSKSEELCSSSWAQIFGEDNQLLYVTSHQLENRVLPQFTAAVRKKLSVASADSDGGSVPDDSLANSTVDQNILFVKSVLQPVAAEKPIINSDGQPFVPVEQVNEFGSVDDYWCAYDVVGGGDSSSRGTIYNYKPEIMDQFLKFLNVWGQDPEPRRDSQSSAIFEVG